MYLSPFNASFATVLLAAAFALTTTPLTALAATLAAAADAFDSSGRASGTSIDAAPKKKVFRVFQTLPQEPSEMDPEEMHRTIRATQAMVFGGEVPSSSYSMQGSPWEGISLALDIYSPAERREYLVARGNKCHPVGHFQHGNGGGIGGGGMANHNDDEDHSSLAWYDVLARYDALLAAAASARSRTSGTSRSASLPLELERMATELWKFCVLYNGDGHAYLDYDPL